jgi:hypothetical protein
METGATGPLHLLPDAEGNIAALAAGGAAGGVLERVLYDPFGKPTFATSDSVPKVDSTGRFAAESDFGNAILYRALRYDPEFGFRTGDPNSDLGGFLDNGGSYFNPNQGQYMSRTPGQGPEEKERGITINTSHVEYETKRVIGSAGAGHNPYLSTPTGDAVVGKPVPGIGIIVKKCPGGQNCPHATNASNPIPGVGIVVKRNPNRVETTNAALPVPGVGVAVRAVCPWDPRCATGNN